MYHIWKNDSCNPSPAYRLTPLKAPPLHIYEMRRKPRRQWLPKLSCGLLLSLILLAPVVLLQGCQAGSEGQEARKDRQRQFNEAAHGTAVRRYLRNVQEHVKAQWKPSEEEASKTGVVFFKIDKEGKVKDLKVKVSTGDALLDQRMLNAVKEASPLPKPPQILENEISLDFSFDMRILSSTSIFDDIDELKSMVIKATRSLEKNPDDTASLKQRALACLAMSDVLSARSAVKDLTRLLEFEREDAELYLLRAQAFKLLREKANFLSDARKAAELKPEVETRLTLVEALSENGDLTEAMAKCEEALTFSPNDADALSTKAFCHLQMHDYQAGIADAEKALAIEPEHGAAYAYRGDCYEALKQYDKALKDYTKSIKFNPDDEYSYLRRARLYLQLSKFGPAVVDATSALEIEPELAEAYYYRACGNKALGLAAQAKRDRLKASSLGFNQAAEPLN